MMNHCLTLRGIRMERRMMSENIGMVQVEVLHVMVLEGIINIL